MRLEKGSEICYYNDSFIQINKNVINYSLVTIDESSDI